MPGDAQGCLVMPGDAWDAWGCLVTRLHLLLHLGMSGDAWGCLGMLGDAWGYLGMPEDAWGCLGMPGDAW